MVSLFAFFSQHQSRKQQTFRKLQNSIAMCVSPNKPCTLAGFEPGSSVSQVDAMTTALCRKAFYLSYNRT
jgi:hypothetical protein